MKSKFLIATFFVLAVTLVSCTTQFVMTPKKIAGKTYYKQNDKTPEMYGGTPTIQFLNETDVHYKVGDMMLVSTYKIEGNAIQFKDQLSDKVFVYVIKDAQTLQDENNEIWKEK